MSLSRIVAGVDVGGSRKGFHAVALLAGAYLDQFASRKAAEIAAWCRQIGASFIGVDAPCRWSATGRARPAERELMAEKIWCFSTPTRERATQHPRNHFGWMLNGAALFRELETTHLLFDGKPDCLMGRVCFETFPQAIACALAGKLVSTKQKGAVRRGLLKRAGLDIGALTNIDRVDAAHCALAAHHLALGRFRPTVMPPSV